MQASTDVVHIHLLALGHMHCNAPSKHPAIVVATRIDMSLSTGCDAVCAEMCVGVLAISSHVVEAEVVCACMCGK